MPTFAKSSLNAAFSMPTTVSLIERLAADKSLRRICGWETRREVPGESTFSRAFEEFAQSELPARMHEALVRRSIGDRVIGCVARDATEIEARENPPSTTRLERRSGTMSLIRVSAMPLVTALETTKRGRPMASFTQ